MTFVGPAARPPDAPVGRLWIVGCGKMAGAMLSRWIATGTIAAEAVDVVNRADRELPAGVRQARTLPEGPLPDMVLLGVKPQQLGTIADRYAERLRGVPLLVSILAGVRFATLSERFHAFTVARAMPNLPVAIGKGVVGLHAPTAIEAAWRRIDALMSPLGLVERVADEALFDAVTALAGSGPAFLYRFAAALAAGGAALGLDPVQADRLARATVEGAASEAAGSRATLDAMADAVASPGGSTRAGLEVLDGGEALQRLVAATLAAARDRNRELAGE